MSLTTRFSAQKAAGAKGNAHAAGAINNAAAGSNVDEISSVLQSLGLGLRSVAKFEDKKKKNGTATATGATVGTHLDFISFPVGSCSDYLRLHGWPDPTSS